MSRNFRVYFAARERGWAPDLWHEDYASLEEALEAFRVCNAKNTAPVAPDYYTHAYQIDQFDEGDRIWIRVR